MKQAKAAQQGITLITVPFWWDRTPQRYVPFGWFCHIHKMISGCFSLIATIKASRPDLLPHLNVTVPPIPLDMPSYLQSSSEYVKDIGEPMTACFLTKTETDPTGW
jgi:hypothetical protein